MHTGTGHPMSAKAEEQLLGKDGMDFASLPPHNDEFIVAFLKEVAARAKNADKRKTKLLIMVFAPVTPEQDICIDFSPDGTKKLKFLAKETIRRAIQDAVGHDKLPVILMTVSPLTTGWACNASLFPGATTFPSANSLQSISRACGAIFADSFMKAFSKRSGPLFTEEQRALLKYEDIMPIGPSDQQKALLYMFQRMVHETLENRMSLSRKTHAPQPDTDAWVTLSERTGISYDVCFETKRPTDGPDANDMFSTFLGDAFGGTQESQIFHLKYLIAMDLETCPGDWTRQVTGIAATKLNEFMNTVNPSLEQVQSVFDIIEFRGSAMIMAQVVAKALDLPIPGDKCRYWMDKTGNDHLYEKLQLGFGPILNLLDKPAVFPWEHRHAFKHVRFYRPSRWLAACVAQKFANASEDAIIKFIAQDVAPIIRTIRETQFELLKTHKSVVEAGMNWIRSLNLGFDVGPSAGTPSGSGSAAKPKFEHRNDFLELKKSTHSAQQEPAAESSDPGKPAVLASDVATEPTGEERASRGTAEAQETGAMESVQKNEKAAVAKSTTEAESGQHDVKPLATTWDEFEKQISLAHKKASMSPALKRPRGQEVLNHWSDLQETPNMHEADKRRRDGYRTGREVAAEKTSIGFEQDVQSSGHDAIAKFPTNSMYDSVPVAEPLIQEKPIQDVEIMEEPLVSLAEDVKPSPEEPAIGEVSAGIQDGIASPSAATAANSLGAAMGGLSGNQSVPAPVLQLLIDVITNDNRREELVGMLKRMQATSNSATGPTMAAEGSRNDGFAQDQNSGDAKPGDMMADSHGAGGQPDFLAADGDADAITGPSRFTPPMTPVNGRGTGANPNNAGTMTESIAGSHISLDGPQDIDDAVSRQGTNGTEETGGGGSEAAESESPDAADAQDTDATEKASGGGGLLAGADFWAHVGW